MIRRSIATSFARAANALFFLLTASYCLLTYNSFAYQQLIRPRLIGWLADFSALHAALFWLSFVVTAATLLPDLRRPAHRLAAGIYLAASCVLGIWLSVQQVLPLVENNGRSFVLALLAMLPPIGLAIVDHLACRLPPVLPSGGGRLLKTTAATGLFTWAIYAAGSLVRARAGGLHVSPVALWLGVSAAAPDHLVVFAAVFAGLVAIAATAAFARAPGATEYFLLVTTFAAAIAVTMRYLVFAAIAFAGPDSWIASIAIAVTIALVWRGASPHCGCGWLATDRDDGAPRPVVGWAFKAGSSAGSRACPLWGVRADRHHRVAGLGLHDPETRRAADLGA